MHGRGIAPRFLRVDAPVIAGLIALALSSAGCGASAAHRTNPARTLALASAAGTVQPGSGPGGSGGASLAPDAAISTAKAPTKAPAGHARTPGTTDSTTAGVLTNPPATSTPVRTAPVAARTVRKKKPSRHVSPPPASPGQSGQVLSCLTSAGLGEVSADRGILWTGWDSRTGTFVYVQAYPTASVAAAQSGQLAPLETAAAGRYVVHQPIARYSASPVPVVAGCLTGHPVHKGKPSKKPGSFTF
ncbi:MAG: hypothetical protein JO027_18040 [Solirubrobacterales bacterium]|nr:hypothetical protein [Solirubrobacterales bacterium]